jgi:hypothetical protein
MESEIDHRVEGELAFRQANNVAVLIPLFLPVTRLRNLPIPESQQQLSVEKVELFRLAAPKVVELKLGRNPLDSPPRQISVTVLTITAVSALRLK